MTVRVDPDAVACRDASPHPPCLPERRVKPEQIQSQLTRVISDAIGGLRDPRVPMIVTVERVTVTADYSLARVYVSAMTGDMEDLLDALRGARGYLQRQVADHVKLRRTPVLEFHDASDRPPL